jgi:hypothetical protein
MLPQGDFNNRRKAWSILMSTRGLYRNKMPDSGAEYARVFYHNNNASSPGEIPRPLYEARGYKPAFDNLPTKGDGEAAQGSNNTNETDIGEQAYTARTRP